MKGNDATARTTTTKFYKMRSGLNPDRIRTENQRRTGTQTYYHTCPHCGARLDPGEHCDCKGEKE